jgi:S-DNA-T family DNA segregation ATPase FtsK/SpoIIIE
MRLKLTLARTTGPATDIAIVVEPTVTIGHLAEVVARRDPQTAGRSATGSLTLAHRTTTGLGEPMLADLSLIEAGIRSGDVVQVVPAESPGPTRGGGPGPTAARVRVLEGPDAGHEFDVPPGTAYLGRGASCDIRLTDPLVSKQHAKLHVSTVAELVDSNSSNGILIDGELVPRVEMDSETVAVLGDTAISVSMFRTPSAGPSDHGASISFNRSPRIEPHYEGIERVAPELPRAESPQKLPVAPMIIPILMAGVLYAVTKSVISIAFVALSPLMYLGNFIERRSSRRREGLHQSEVFESAMTSLERELIMAAETERSVRSAENPSIVELLPAVEALQPLTWTRRPGGSGFLAVRLGMGPLPSRSTVTLADRQVGGPLFDRVIELKERFAAVNPVPVVAELGQGALGVAGEDEGAGAVARALVGQLVALHSPAELVVAAVASAATAPGWDWLKWTPHVSSPGSPLTSPHLAVGRGACHALVAEIEGLIDERTKADHGCQDLPIVVLLVRSRIADIARRGPTVGVAVVWKAPSVERLPASCRTYIEIDVAAGWARAVFVEHRDPVLLSDVESLPPNAAMRLARRLAPLVDVAARTEDSSDLPSSVSFVGLAGRDVAYDPHSVLERWRESGSIIDRNATAVRRRSKESGLRALIGQSAVEPLFLDLRAQGPHALVGGTTGAGKSELLQSWILGMAVAYSPDRVTFLLVDYKGGSAFGQCRELPHTVGMVTDLSVQLARRALTSLGAELRYREHVLNRKRAKDLIELERSGDPDAPPSLVIVIDEFAALVQELPEFVDGVVNIAQRGRSLGLHLILATQRPAGVVKDNLRANTNLRIALRMADEADSADVLDTPVAASFDPAIPGRAMAKLGPGRQVPFQSAYVGGITSDEPPPPDIVIEELALGTSKTWEEPDEAGGISTAVVEEGPTDIQRMVRTIREAAEAGSIAKPRLPWLEELAPIYDLRDLETTGQDSELVFGVRDDPQQQAQPMASFRPDRDGNMIIYGTGGSGKSTALRTIAVAAGLSVRGGPCQVHGIDAGSRGLSLIEDLPHVGSVVDGDDTELVGRLLQTLRATIDERAERYARVKAGSIAEYRALAEHPDEARIFLLVDGVGPFRQSCESGERAAMFDTFVSLAVDGRPVGIHVVGTADRLSAVPSALASTMQNRLVLRLSAENDMLMLSIPNDAFEAGSPPGRGYSEGDELQVAVLGGSANIADQATAISQLATTMRSRNVTEAPTVERLPELVALSALPVELEGLPVIGLSSTTLGPMTFRPRGGFLVAGPPGSGRTSTLHTLALAIRRWKPEAHMIHLASVGAEMRDLLPWHSIGVGVDEIADVAKAEAVRVINSEFGDLPVAVFIEGLSDLLNTPADIAIQELTKAAISAGHVVIAEGDPAVLGSASPLLQALKGSRYGIALQPEQVEGALVFKTAFPRVSRAQFPVGRGLFVSSGHTGIIQVAMPV